MPICTECKISFSCNRQKDDYIKIYNIEVINKYNRISKCNSKHCICPLCYYSKIFSDQLPVSYYYGIGCWSSYKKEYIDILSVAGEL